MGSYTTNLKLYKPSPDEFVDVETQFNDNWDMADAAVRRLFEYQYSNEITPTTSDYNIGRQRFYKTYSNSLVNYFKASTIWIQDSIAFVSPWVDISTTIDGGAGYSSHPTLKPAYRIIKKTGGTTTEVEMAGAFWLDESPMDLNTNVQILLPGGFPAEMRPTVSKYFNMWGGNTTSDYSFARILIGSDGRLEFKRYGVNPSVTTENRIEFTGIKYNLEAAA